ncbi:hypothetical protein [Xanthobacter wiegelii]
MFAQNGKERPIERPAIGALWPEIIAFVRLTALFPPGAARDVTGA